MLVQPACVQRARTVPVCGEHEPDLMSCSMRHSVFHTISSITPLADKVATRE